MKWFLPLLLLTLAISCKEETLTISKIGEFRFRRSYADIHFWEEADPRKIDSIRFSNPTIAGDSFSINESEILLGLSQSGILDFGHNLIRQRFPESVNKAFKLTHEDGRQTEAAFIHPAGEEKDHYLLVISNNKSKAVFNLEEHYGALNRDISYLLLDLMPGGYPEIVVLNEYYIMNGDNSDIYIYEVTE